jgi:pyruvate/2-oxoglutarate dehydrogenase complex dihydrolipoamide dehydrogenase (E3) component
MNPKFHLFKFMFLALVIALLLGACATVNWDYPRMPSNAFTHPETTSVGALFQEAADKHPGLSGFTVVQHGENAFLARLAMADYG